MNEIKIGDALLNYITDIMNIEVKLGEVANTVNHIIMKLNDGQVYQGKAQNEMLSFYSSLLMHVGKMMSFYQIVGAVTFQIYEEAYFNEEEIIRWILNIQAH